MAKMGKRISPCLAFVLISLGALLPANANAAWSGEITHAEANAEWTEGHIAGWVEWTGCEHWVAWEPGPPWGEPKAPWEYPGGEFWEHSPDCGWIPFVTVGPGSEAAECASKDRRLNSLGEDVTLAWIGDEEIRPVPTYTETTDFDVPEVLLSGGAEQLVCLSLIEIAPEHVFCVQIYPSPCPPYWMARFQHEFDSAQMVTAPDAESPGEESGESDGSEEEDKAVDEESGPIKEPEGSSSTVPGNPSTGQEIIGGPNPGPSASSLSPKPTRCVRGKHRVKRAGHPVCRHGSHRHRHRGQYTPLTAS